MLKKISIGLACLMCAFSAIAQSQYNFVKSARVNGLEMTEIQSMASIQTAFGQSLNLAKLQTDNECTGNPEATLKYKNKSIFMEFFPEQNPKGINLANPNSKASIWITWQTTSNMTDKIKLDHHTINANMRFDEFKKTFPLSAKMVMVDQSNKDLKTYTVLIGGDPNDEELAYRRHIDFVFKNNQLIMLSLQQGIAC